MTRRCSVASCCPARFLTKSLSLYRKYLFGTATLQDLPPDPPRFVINATSVQTGALFRFSRPFAADYRVGMIPNPAIELAIAVAASSAFPPVLSPLKLELDPAIVGAAERISVRRPAH